MTWTNIYQDSHIVAAKHLFSNVFETVWSASSQNRVCLMAALHCSYATSEARMRARGAAEAASIVVAGRKMGWALADGLAD